MDLLHRFAAIAQESLLTSRDPVLAAADGYSYLHLLLVAGVIIFAVGAREEVAHAGTAGRPGAAGPVRRRRPLPAGGVAFRLRMVGTVARLKIAVALGCLLVYAATSSAAAWVPAASLAALLGVLVVSEQLREPSPASPGGPEPAPHKPRNPAFRPETRW